MNAAPHNEAGGGRERRDAGPGSLAATSAIDDPSIQRAGLTWPASDSVVGESLRAPPAVLRAPTDRRMHRLADKE